MSGDPWNWNSLRLIDNWAIPRGQAIYMEKSAMAPSGPLVLVHPSTGMELRNGGRTPLWTRHMLGVREAERDRRKVHGSKRVR